MNILQTEVLINSAGLKHPEDGIVLPRMNDRYPTYGVFDAYSSPYSGEPPLENGLTTGQRIISIIVNAFSESLQDPSKSLGSIILKSSQNIWTQENSEYDDPGLYAGASFVVIKIYDDYIDLLQGGDCVSIWIDKKGKIFHTPNKFYPFDWVTEVMLGMHEDPKKSRKMELEVLMEIRREYANKSGGYSIINGDREVQNHWFEVNIPLENLNFLLMFTDGFVPFRLMADLENLSRDIVSLLKRGYSLGRILNRTRITESPTKKEATAMLLSF